MSSLKDLEVYRNAFNLALRVHKMTMKLPKYEFYEIGSQVRRSSKSIKDNIAEGFGRRRYKPEFVRFLVYAQASCDETISQLETIRELHKSILNICELLEDYNKLGKQINSFIQYVDKQWLTSKTSNQ